MTLLLRKATALCAGFFLLLFPIAELEYAAVGALTQQMVPDDGSRSVTGVRKQAKDVRRNRLARTPKNHGLNGCGNGKTEEGRLRPTAKHTGRSLSDLERAEEDILEVNMHIKNQRLRGLGNHQPTRTGKTGKSRGKEGISSACRSPIPLQGHHDPAGNSENKEGIQNDNRRRSHDGEWNTQEGRLLQGFPFNSLGIPPRNADNYVFFYGLTTSNGTLGLSATGESRGKPLLPALPGSRSTDQGFLTPYNTNPYYTTSLIDPNY